MFSPYGVRLAFDQKAWLPLSRTFRFSSSVRGVGLLGLAFVNYICWSPLHFPASPPVSSFALRLVFWLLQLSHVLLAIFPTFVWVYVGFHLHALLELLFDVL